MLEPHWVQFHTAEVGSFPMLVTQHGADEHMGGSVLVVGAIAENEAGLGTGWNERTHIGRGDASKGASWSPIDGIDEDA